MYENIVKALRCCTTFDCPPECPRQGYGKGCITALKKDAANAIDRLEYALILMVLQYCTDDDGTIWHQYMSAGETAFATLGITLKTNPQVLWERLEELEKKEAHP